MSSNRQTVCLCMIVKDEAPVIRRCLASVRPLIDHWLIVDTGSRDGTQAIIRAAMADLPGELVERPWVDFAHNRSEALALARPRADYSLIFDADDELVLPPDFQRPPLDADSYMVDIEDVSIAYRRTQLVSNALPWRYVGVLHEFLTCEEARSAGRLPVVMRRNHDGRRRRDPKTYENDAAVLGRALESEKDPFLVARYTFYLAQSYRDCDERERALTAYLRRAGQGFWDQEIYVSLLNAGRLMEALGHPVDAVLGVYRAANAACAGRAEAAHAAARLCRQHDRFAEGYAFAKAAIDTPAPADGLFVESWIYAYGLADELGVHAYWSGHYRDCLEACDRLLREGRMPADMRPRIEANRGFAAEKLDRGEGDGRDAGSTSGTGWAPTRPQGGTEIMVEALRSRMGPELDAVDLRINLFDPTTLDARPLVVWIHHDMNQGAVQWCNDKALVARVVCFVFISHWQRERFMAAFGLPPDRCVVIRYAIDQTSDFRRWEPAPVLRCAYTSTPFRGLDVLLDAWDRLPPGLAELHIWSSMKLYTHDDGPYEHLFERARSTPSIVYHGLAPNEELRARLRDIHILAYPSTFAETACRSVMEAMAAGCRVIVPSLGALPETTGGYARIYPWTADPRSHTESFAGILAEEIANPWRGRPDLAMAQQAHCATVFAWSRCLDEWRSLIGALRSDAPIAVKAVVPPRAAAVASVPPPKSRLHECLARLRDSGFSPRTIVDVGAYDGEFSRFARSLFSDAHILMIDALAEKQPVLEDVCRDLGNATSLIALLGESEVPATPFFVADTTARPDLVKTGSSKYRENSAFPMHARDVPQRTLHRVLEERGIVCNLLKLDVQGAELDVLRGCGSHLAQVEVIVMEMSLLQYNEGAPLIADMLHALKNMGFVLFDIVDELRYRDGALLQIDGVFARPDARFLPRPPFWS